MNPVENVINVAHTAARNVKTATTLAEYRELPRLARLQLTRATIIELMLEHDGHDYTAMLSAVDRRIEEVENGTAPEERD